MKAAVTRSAPVRSTATAVSTPRPRAKSAPVTPVIKATRAPLAKRASVTKGAARQDTGTRRAVATTTAPGRPAAKPAPATRAPAQRAAGKRPAGASPLGKRVTRFAAPPVRVVKVRPLDPVARCGMGTSVEQLYRVDERVDGRCTTVHLVFFDKYGWYCVHGRGCTAVADVHQDLRAQRRSVPRLAATTTTRAAGR